jgi:membrane protease YdiL (CAAX protease family)
MPGPADLALVAVLVIVSPLYAMRQRRRLERDLADGVPDARLKAYRRLVVTEWGVTAVLLVLWIVAGRELTLLGLRPPDGVGFVIAAAISVAITMLLVVQMRALRRKPEVAAQVRAAAAPVAFLLPATPAELRGFYLVSLTAGILEELYYRGFLMWYLGVFGPAWLALLLSALLFGTGHLYQGPAGIVKTGVAGVFLGALYWLSGSLWMPMLAHTVVDVLNGRIAYEVSASGEDLAARPVPSNT